MSIVCTTVCPPAQLRQKSCRICASMGGFQTVLGLLGKSVHYFIILKFIIFFIVVNYFIVTPTD